MSNNSDKNLSERKKTVNNIVKEDSFDTEADNLIMQTRNDGRSPT